VDPKLVTAVVAALAVMVAAVLNRPRRLPDRYVALTSVTEIFNKLPEGPTRTRVLALVDEEVGRLEEWVAVESVGRRNWYGVFWAVVFIAAGGALGWVFVSGGGLWLMGLILPVALILSGAIVFAQNIGKVPRASNGQSLAYQEERAAKASRAK
jgi:hypothetical protein